MVPIRAHAAGALDDGERVAVELVRDRWLARRFADAPLDWRRGQTVFFEWLDDNAATLRASLESTLLTPANRAEPAAGRGPGPTSPMSPIMALVGYWFQRGRMAEAEHWVGQLRSRPDGAAPDPLDRVLIDAADGFVLALQHQGPPAAERMRACRPLLAAPPPERVEDAARALINGAACAWTGDIWDVAAEYVESALALARDPELPHVLIVARAIRAANLAFAGDTATGLAQAQQVLRDNRDLGNDLAALFALVALSLTALFGGEPAAALRWSDELLLTHRRMGALAVGDTVETRAAIRAAAGDPAGAIRCLGASAALNRRTGRDWPWHERTTGVLDRLRDTVAPDEFARHWAGGERLGLGDPARLTPEWI